MPKADAATAVAETLATAITQIKEKERKYEKFKMPKPVAGPLIPDYLAEASNPGQPSRSAHLDDHTCRNHQDNA